MEDSGALEGMKRAELQRLAKKAGIKANMKTDAIIQALKKHYSGAGPLLSVEGTSCSEDNTSHDEMPGSVSESTGVSANEEQLEETNSDSTPPKKTVRKGRKGRKRTKAASKSTKASEQKSASPAACAAPTPTSVAVKTNTPKAQGPTDTGSSTTPASAAELPLRRKTRSITPKTASVVPVSKVTPVPVEPSERRKTRSVTPKTQQGQLVAAVPARRRRTYEIEEEQADARNVVKTKSEADPEMKKAIMAQLEQKAEEKLSQSRIPKPKAASKPSKPVTPGNKDWRRIHQAHFDKMESIDDYVARKRKRTETLSASVKKAKLTADATRAAVENLTARRTPERSAAKIAKPVSRLRPSNLPFDSPKSSGAKRPAAKGCTSVQAPTSKAPATKSVTFKMSRLKTPTRAALLLAGGGETKPKRKSTPGPRKSISAIDTSAKKPMLDLDSRKSISRKSVGEAAWDKRKSIGVGTPFKFGATATTPAADTLNKPVFDLKASLSKPLTYKPHTGKLKPLEVSTRFQATSNLQKAKAKVLKKPALKTRDDRRGEARQNRANKRADTLMERRGITAL